MNEKLKTTRVGRTLLPCLGAAGLLLATVSMPLKASAREFIISSSKHHGPSTAKEVLLGKAIMAQDEVAARAALENGANPNGVVLVTNPNISVGPTSRSTVRPTTPKKPKRWAMSKTLLSLAIMRANLDVIKLLIRYGADLNPKSEPIDGYPLSNAALGGHLEVVELLLSYKVSVNPKLPPYQRSPLALASHNDAEGLPIMKLLIGHGADVNARFQDNETVMTIASRQKRGAEAVALLKEHGATQ